jgi:4-alpha-glucanotransferase
MKLFIALQQALGEGEIIAEDLGYVTDSVRQLVADSGYAGMKVLEFAFDSRDTGSARDYLPHNYPVNAVAYTGTHDNAPLEGWLSEITEEEKDKARRYICSDAADEQLYWPLVCAVLRSPARLAVIPMQDYLGYGNEARINQPSTMGKNWRWRLLPGECSPELAEKIRSAAILYGRKEEA